MPDPSSGLGGRLEAGAHFLPVRIYFEDTDFSGVVYHGSYVRFMTKDGRSGKTTWSFMTMVVLLDPGDKTTEPVSDEGEGESGASQHKCAECGRVFTTSSGLGLHRKAHAKTLGSRSPL